MFDFNFSFKRQLSGISIGLCLLSSISLLNACNTTGIPTESPSPQATPQAKATPEPTPLAIPLSGGTPSADTRDPQDFGYSNDDIASVGPGDMEPYPAPLFTPTPFPSSQLPPTEVGPTAVPSSFSPQCPVGEGYSIPYPSPVATPIPTASSMTPPPPLAPHQVVHNFALPFELSQHRFCDPSQFEHWAIDTQGILMHQAHDAPITRVQLTSDQINDLLALLNQNQPQQQTVQFEPLYRCQAAEICPLENSVSVSTATGGHTGWSDRGNLIYPERYTQTLNQIVDLLETARRDNPATDVEHTYQSAMSMRSFNAQERVTGTSYVLLPTGDLRRLQDNTQEAEILLTPAQQESFRKLLQTLDPIKQYEALFNSDQIPTHDLAGNTLWGFEYERFSNIPGAYGGTVGTLQMPDTPAAEALKADLQQLLDQLKAFFETAESD